MGFWGRVLGTDYGSDAKARERGRKAHGKQVKRSVKANNKKAKTSDERGYGAKGGGWFS